MSADLPDRDQILARHPIKAFFINRGDKLTRIGEEYYMSCPFHPDGKRPNFRIDTVQQVWCCDVCGFGGSVIDFVMRSKGVSKGDAMMELSGGVIGSGNGHYRPPEPELPPVANPEKKTIKKSYDYVDASGKLICQSVRFEPKTFAQRRPDGNGGWIWDLKGVTRVLYRLPRVLKSTQPVWIVEGEKDVDTLTNLGLIATCNIGGAKKWMDAYNDALKGKEIVICPDNDDAGAAHRDKVMQSVSAVAKSIRLITVPQPHKDVSDLHEAEGNERTVEILSGLFDAAVELVGGIELPVYTMEESEAHYSRFVTDPRSGGLDLSKWLPSLAKCIRPLSPGDFAVFLAGTGVGKTAWLQNLVLNCDAETLFFEMEVTRPSIFERFAQIVTGSSSVEVEAVYKNRNIVQWRNHPQLQKLLICDKSNMTTELIEDYIIKSELKMGHRPKLVVIDYIQLIKGKGSRYERFSDISENLKSIAKKTNTVVFAASQIARKEDGVGAEVYLNDAKDSGSIENSSGLILGGWRDDKDATKLFVKVLKCTKGKPGARIACVFDGERMTIKEKPKIDPGDTVI